MFQNGSPTAIKLLDDALDSADRDFFDSLLNCVLVVLICNLPSLLGHHVAVVSFDSCKNDFDAVELA